MPRMIFKVFCKKESCQSVIEMLEGKNLSVDYEDKEASDYYAVAKDMSYLDADKLREDLEKDPRIFEVKPFPVLGNLRP